MKEKIKSLRKAKGATLEEVAKGCGMVKSSMWELENKNNSRPSFETVRKIADYFQVSLDYFTDSVTYAESKDAHFVNAYLSADESTKDKTRRIFDVLNDKGEKTMLGVG